MHQGLPEVGGTEIQRWAHVMLPDTIRGDCCVGSRRSCSSVFSQEPMLQWQTIKATYPEIEELVPNPTPSMDSPEMLFVAESTS